jgi:hypothetical protein
VKRWGKSEVIISNVDHNDVNVLAETAIRLIAELGSTVTEMSDILKIPREP